MDFRETLNCQDYTKLDKFSKQLRALNLNDSLQTRICLKCVRNWPKLIRMRSLVYAQKLMDIKQVLWMH